MTMLIDMDNGGLITCHKNYTHYPQDGVYKLFKVCGQTIIFVYNEKGIS